MKYLAALMIVLGLCGIAQAASECMACQTKCRVCFNAGKSTFPSIAACVPNCKETGNPSVLSTCGVRAVCPADKR